MIVACVTRMFAVRKTTCIEDVTRLLKTRLTSRFSFKRKYSEQRTKN